MLSLRKIADEHLRLGIEVVGHDVEVAVVVEIEDDRGAAGAGRHHDDFARLARARPRVHS